MRVKQLSSTSYANIPSFPGIFCSTPSSELVKGTIINDLGLGLAETEKKNCRPFSRKKINFEIHSPGKKIERPCLGKKIYGGGSREKINSFQKFPPPSQIINPLSAVGKTPLESAVGKTHDLRSDL